MHRDRPTPTASLRDAPGRGRMLRCHRAGPAVGARSSHSDQMMISSTRGDRMAKPGRARQKNSATPIEAAPFANPAKLRGELEVLGCFLAAAYHHVERDVLALGEAGQAGLLHSGDVDEHILAAVGALDEAVSLRGIEPFDNALVHRPSFPLTLKTHGRFLADRATT